MFIITYNIRLLIIFYMMKTEADDMNYESMITKLAKGSIEEKAYSIKKLLFLYQNARSRIYLYERRITQSLELSLLIQQKDISLNALNLLQKIIANASVQSEIAGIIRKRLLSKVVVNLGSVSISIRKVSHKCISEYLRKFKDYENLISTYLKTAMKQQQNNHLKVKSINSLHSLLMGEARYFTHNSEASLALVQELIESAYQKSYVQIRKAALLCLLAVLRIDGSQNSLKQISAKVQNNLYQLTFESQQLAALLQVIMKYKNIHKSNDQSECQTQNNAPSPKFISIQDTQVLIKNQEPIQIIDQFQQKNYDQVQVEKIPQNQLKIYNEVSFAQQFLKKLQKTTNWQLEQIKGFAPYLEKYLIDESIKLFSISKKIVEVIFDTQERKQFYVVIVPCVVNGIGNKRFIVRKNLDKLVRQYVKNHTEIWVQNFIERFATSHNAKIKQILIDLFMHAYKNSPQFYCQTGRPFEVFDVQIANKNSNLRWKAIDCVLMILERQGKDNIQGLLTNFSLDTYNKILRKMNKNTLHIGSQNGNSGILQIQPISPSISIKRQSRRHRLITDQPQKLQSIDKDDQKSQRNISEGKKLVINQAFQMRQKKIRRSHMQIQLRSKRNTEKRSKQSIKDKERTSLQKLPQLKGKKQNNSLSKNETASESPVKKSFTQKSIMYIERQNLKQLQDPKSQLEKALVIIKDSSNWMTQFQSINSLRSIIEHNSSILSDEAISNIVSELLACLNNLKSGVMKISLICLGQLIQKVKKKIYPFTQSISSNILKKSVSTSQFMADQLKKCICICAEELCLSKLIPVLQGLKQSKSNQIKINILLMIETMSKVEKIYKKETEWIWSMLIDFHDQPQFQIRSQCKKVVKTILQLYKSSWKNDVTTFKKYNLQKIDKILKNLNQKGQNSWIQQQNSQFQKIITSKGITSKYFASQCAKFQEQDKIHLNKKNWKDRIKLLSDVFNLAFQHPIQFQNNANAKKYLIVACQHLDEKNPGLLLNAINVLIKSIQAFPSITQDFIGYIIEKYIAVIETKRAELISMYLKLMQKLYKKFDINKILKEFLRLSLHSSLKVKVQALNQVIYLLRDEEISSIPKQKEEKQLKIKNKENNLRQISLQGSINISFNRINLNPINSHTPTASNSHSLIGGFTHNSENSISLSQNRKKINMTSQNMLAKIAIKLSADKYYESTNLNVRIKQLIGICSRKFGQDFANKISMNDKLVDMLE